MKQSTLVSHIVLTTFAAVLAGCGLAETGAVAGAQAASAAEQAQQGKELADKIEADVTAAQAANKQAIDAAEAASQ